MMAIVSFSLFVASEDGGEQRGGIQMRLGLDHGLP